MDELSKELQVLFLSYDGMTDPLGQSQVLPYLAGLSRHGYKIGIVSFEKHESYEKSKAQIDRICLLNNLAWFPLRYTKKPPVISTAYDLFRLKRLVSALLKVNPVRFIHCRSYITALIGLNFKRRKGIPFIFDMRGFWADERVDGDIWNIQNPLFKRIYKYFKKKEKEFLMESAYTISLTLAGKKEIEKNILGGMRGAPIKVIPCCVDVELFDSASITDESVRSKRAQLGIPSDVKVLSYIGSVGTWYMLDEMLLFFKCWLERMPKSIFLFVTTEPSSYIFNTAKKVGIDSNAIRVTSASRNEMPAYIACSDCSVFFIKPLYSKIASSPTKQGEIMSIGKPIVCNSRVGDSEFILNDCHSGIVVDSFQLDDLRSAVDTYISTVFDSSVIRSGALRYFALQNGIDKYLQVYNSISR